MCWVDADISEMAKLNPNYLQEVTRQYVFFGGKNDPLKHKIMLNWHCPPQTIANLKLPDLLALLRHLSHCLPHQSDQHVQQQHEGEDDVGNQQD